MNKRRNQLWQNVTGSVDDNEKFIDAAKREAFEETGLEIANIKNITESNLIFTFTDQWENKVEEKVYFIECREKWDIVIDPDEHEDYKWENESEISQNSVHYISNYQAIKEAIELKC